MIPIVGRLGGEAVGLRSGLVAGALSMPVSYPPLSDRQNTHGAYTTNTSEPIHTGGSMHKRNGHAMKNITINVEDWPESFIGMVEDLAEQINRHVRRDAGHQELDELPRWPGVAPPPEQLRREEIYKDVC